ncbi:MAG TPA: hypothetical protein VEC76_11680 [Streptosporangiaceae bacterium]|nr:hypothetical protein [Streptosporangiaceae bacterium]
MNTGPADTRSSHLDLADLIAEANGQAIDDRAREHLVRCEHCRAEASRWHLVAGGVRGLAAAAPEVAQPARPRHGRLRVLTGPRRRTLLVASVAAALVLATAVGLGVSNNFVHIKFGTGGNGAGPVLTAVTGCTGLEQAVGRLEQVNGNSLVVKTASGQPVTVTTTASTFVSMSGALRSEITDGASVMVRGTRSGATIAAAIVTVGQPFSAVNPPGYVPVQGTVSEASSAGFTLVTSGGTRIPVTTSADTLVIVPHASLGQLQHGATIFAFGHAGPDGTLSARAVTGITQFPPGGPAGAHLHISVHLKVGAHVNGCSPRAIAAALLPGS